jgi:hypothetical protein
MSNFNNDINDRTVDEFLNGVRERQKRANQIERNKFILSLQQAIREAIRLSQESFRNGDEYNGERFAFQVEQLRLMLRQFS